MASHGLMLGKNQDLPLTHNQQLETAHGLDMVQDLPLTHNQQLEIAHGHDMVLDCSHGLGLGQNHENHLDLERAHGHDLGSGDLEKNGLEFTQTDDPEPDHVSMNVNNNDDGLRLYHEHEFGLSDNLALAIAKNPHDLHEQLDLTADHDQDTSIVPFLDSDHSQLVVSSPVIQSRALVPARNHELAVGQEFPDVHSCRRALRETAIALHFEIQTIKSDKARFTAKCADNGCPWRIHAAKLPGVPTFTIRTIHESHTCGGITHLGHQQASVQWVANTVEQRLRENPNFKPKEILEEIHRVHGIALTYKQAWRGKERIMANVRGSFEDEYRLLPQYCHQIRRTNPGSIATVYGSPTDSCFQRLFVSFEASIYGFLNACRPLIGLDRTVLKSKYLGALLFATGFDGEGALYPLAFGVVDEENDDNWMWFLSELHNLLDINAENMPRLTILSDRQKAIVYGVDANFPTAFHGFCMHHLSESFRREFNCTKLMNLFWEAAHALTVTDFDEKMVVIEEESQDAALWIRQIPPHLWATAYFEGARCGHLTANIAESLNTWVHDASGLPIIQMMECIRRQLMTWFTECREMSMQWTSVLVPSANRHLSEAIERAHTYQVLRPNEAECEVVSHEGTFTVMSHDETFIVDIRSRRCYCNGWQLCGLPCSHAVAALLHCRQNVHRFAESWFTVANYRKAYSQTIHPIPDKTLWEEMSQGFENESDGALVVINPPKSVSPPGRQRKRRGRKEDEGRAKRAVRCSRCNQTGHFRTTCAAPM